MSTALAWTARPRPDEAAEAVALLEAAAAVDRVEAVSEAALLRLRPRTGPGDGGAHLLVRDGDGRLVGYAGLEEGERPTAEFAVHPAHRRRGTGGAVLAALLDRVPGPLWLWAHGEHPAALALAARARLHRDRELWQLRRDLADPVEPRALPDGVALRAFRPGADEDALVAVNARTFAWHPEQGGWQRADVLVREAEPWFDPAGLLLAVDAEDRVRGFHWTKVHGDGAGEVYVLGVDPGAQGGGLGAALTTAGLAHLRARGAREVLLYVESDNAAALRTYTRLGFTRYRADVEFVRRE